MSEESPVVLVEKESGIATVTLNRPRSMNALSRELQSELIVAFGALALTRENALVFPVTLVAWLLLYRGGRSGSGDAPAARGRFASAAWVTLGVVAVLGLMAVTIVWLGWQLSL